MLRHRRGAMKPFALGLAAAAFVFGGLPAAWAAITETDSTGIKSDFSVSNNDLVNQGQATLTSATRSHVPLHSQDGDFGGYDPNNTGLNVPYANDGQFGVFNTEPWGKDVEYYPSTEFAGTATPAATLLPVTYTFTLNTSLNTAGYDIFGLTSTCGYLWNSDWTANQVFQVEITKDGSTWINLGTYTYKPYTTDAGTDDKMSQVGLSNTGGGALNNGTDVAQHVTGIRITYSDPGNTSGFTGTAIKEIDVLGMASEAYVVSAAASTCSASPTNVASDGVTPSTITVTLKDAGGNPIPGKPVTLASNRGAMDSISAASGVSSGSGVVIFMVTSTNAGAAVFTATDTSDSPNAVVTHTATVTFLSDAVSAANSTVTASPVSVAADGSAASTINVTLRDADNIPLSDKAVTLAKTSGPGSPVITPSSATTDMGVATFTVKSTTAGTDVFTATEIEDSVVLAQTATVTFTAGAVDAGASTVVAAPTAVPADDVAASAITVTLLDANSNPVTNKTVTLASSRDATDTISAASGLSGDSGVVTFTVTSTTAGAPEFTATGDSVELGTKPAVTFTPVSAENSTVTASPASVVADGSATSTITVTLKDVYGNPFSGKAVTLVSSRGATDTISAASGSSDASGVVTFTVTSTTAGSSVFTATGDGITLAPRAAVTFTPVPAILTWGPATDVTIPAGASGVLSATTTGFVDTDVKTNGTFVAAVCNGNAGTVNGVIFQGCTGYSGSSGLFTYGSSPISLQWSPENGENRNFNWGGAGNAYGTFGYDIGSGKNLLLTGGGDGVSPGTITLSSLVADNIYQVQIWAPTWDNSGTVAVGGVGIRKGEPMRGESGPYTLPQYVVGTFTADGTSQTISWSGIAPTAVSLHTLTPPMTGTMLIIR